MGEQRLRRCIGETVLGALDLLIGEPRRRSHERALKLMAQQLAVPVDPQMGGKARPVFIGLQRTPAIRKLLGQHRHDPVREVDGIAAFIGHAVKGVAGTNVMGDIRDGDEEVPAA